MSATTAASLTFDADLHLYRDENGVVRPSVTGLLERAGLVDDSFFTEEGRHRGTVVHQLTLDMDLDAITLKDVMASQEHRDYRGYVAAYAAVREMLRPDWEFLEQAFMTPPTMRYRFGGKPDRGGEIRRAKSAFELKTGGPCKSHAIQLALQAILLATQWRIPAVTIKRYVCRLQPNGKFAVDEFTRRADFDTAHDILRRYAA